MFPKQLKRPLLIAHRWVALGLAPVFLLVLLSGAILAFKPILGTDSTVDPSARVSAGAVAAALAAIDPAGRATAVSLSADGRSISVKSKDPAVAGTFDVATRTAAEHQGFDLFAVALNLHKTSADRCRPAGRNRHLRHGRPADCRTRVWPAEVAQHPRRLAPRPGLVRLPAARAAAGHRTADDAARRSAGVTRTRTGRADSPWRRRSRPCRCRPTGRSSRRGASKRAVPWSRRPHPRASGSMWSSPMAKSRLPGRRVG